MSLQPPLSLLAVLLLVAMPALAAPTHTGTWTASVEESHLQLTLRMKGEHGGLMGDSVPLTVFQGLSTANGSTAPFQLVREAGTFQFEGSFSNGEGAGHFQFEPNQSFGRSMAALGYSQLSPDEYYQFALVDISTARLKELASLGYKDIPREELLQVGIFQVTAEYVRTLASEGYAKLTLDELVQFRIHGVTPAFIRDMREVGYPNVPPEDLVRMRIHGIDPEYVRALSGGKRAGEARKKP